MYDDTYVESPNINTGRVQIRAPHIPCTVQHKSNARRKMSTAKSHHHSCLCINPCQHLLMENNKNYLYSIHAWHIFHGVKWEMNEPEIEALLKATEKATPESSKMKKRGHPTPRLSSEPSKPNLTSTSPSKWQYMHACAQYFMPVHE